MVSVVIIVKELKSLLFLDFPNRHLTNWHKGTPEPTWMPYNTLIRTKNLMTTLNLTERQIIILNLALTTLYDEITKSGEGIKMKDEIMEFSRYIQKQTLEN